MTSQIRGFNQASRNANDGISVAQTTEGSLNQINDNLQRIRELTVQAQNGTNTTDDLASIQKEVDQRLEEIDRIARDTQFNGTNLLDGSKDKMTIQVGTQDTQVIEFELKNMNVEGLQLGTGSTRFSVAGRVTNVATDPVAIGDSLATANGVSWGTSGADDTATTLTWEQGGTTATGFTLVKAADDTLYASKGGKLFNVTLAGTSGSAGDGSDTELKVTVGTEVPGTPVTATADPLTKLDEAIKLVDTMRSDLGAIQNRFQSAIQNITTTSLNLSAARSRIEDADYAVEVSNMTRAQILQQAGTSVLAQANQVPQGVLSLLR